MNDWRRRHPVTVADWSDRAQRLAEKLIAEGDLRSPQWRSAVCAVPRQLAVTEGHRVLEIGTGTGYNAALLAHRLGSSNLFSVDVDPALIDTARPRLARLGYHPRLVAADGTGGLAEHAPFDRIIATCSVPAIPTAWIEQLRPGGRILADVEGPLGAGNLVTLHKPSAAALVAGRFLPWWGRFMRLRPHPGPTVGAPRPRRAPGQPRSGSSTVDPAELDKEFRFLAQLFLPCGTVQSLTPSADLTRPVTTCLITPNGSWCEVDRDPGPDSRYRVRFGGLQSLWDQVDTAWGQWIRHNQPAWSEFGLTATPDHHTIWLTDPDSGPSWPLPTLQ